MLGVALATVGLDPFTGTARFTFGVPELLDGFQQISVLVGLLAVSEILTQARDARPVERFSGSVSSKLVSWREFRPLLPLVGWTSILGMILGVLPGTGATVSSLVAYSEAKRWSKHPERFGKGSLEGVAAPEAANNACVPGAMVPLLAFGIPGSGSAAVMIAALMLHGVVPGPMLMEKHPEIVYGLFAGLFVATFMMLALGWASIRPLVRLVAVPKGPLLAVILVLVVVGSYSHNSSVVDVAVTLAFGVLGYLMNRYGYSAAACVLGFVLGPMIEISLRRSLVLSNQSAMVFVERPVALALLVLALLTFVIPLVRSARQSWKARPSRA